MTEAEWLACEEPGRMLNSIQSIAQERKLRLFACACFRVADLGDAGDKDILHTLLISERLADREVSAQELQEAQRRLGLGKASASPIILLLVSRAFISAQMGSQMAADLVGLRAESTAWQDHLDIMPEERRRQANLLVDIFGNPFRPVAFDPAWLTSSVTAIAQGMYESRDFNAMPILADALQDAGCDSEEVLAHCRGDGPHVRGCWVVDAILGKA